MKKLATFTLISWLIGSCTDSIPKPKNLISEDKMIDILYDLNMFQAISSNNYQLFNSYNLNPELFIYQKYDIDSLQFAQSHQYYISNIDKYEKMLEKLIDKTQLEKDSISKINTEELEK